MKKLSNQNCPKVCYSCSESQVYFHTSSIFVRSLQINDIPKNIRTVFDIWDTHTHTLIYEILLSVCAVEI